VIHQGTLMALEMVLAMALAMGPVMGLALEVGLEEVQVLALVAHSCPCTNPENPSVLLLVVASHHTMGQYLWHGKKCTHCN
jgi:hypothetical protein